MRSGDYPYPADEFDAAARAGGPRGVHRAPRTWWSRWWPFVVVLVVFPVIAYLGINALSDWDGLAGSDDPPVVAPEDPVDEDLEPDTEEPEPEPDPEPEPEPEPEPAPEPDLGRAVQVYNATGITGLAGGARTRLEGAGFTAVSTGNWAQEVPAASAVYYPDDADLGTAELIAQTLGITAVEQSAENAPDGVVVVLTGDYSP